MIKTVEAYFEPILDIKLNPIVKAKMLEYVVDKLGYLGTNRCEKINADNDSAYFTWRNEKTVVFSNKPYTSKDYSMYPRYEW